MSSISATIRLVFGLVISISALIAKICRMLWRQGLITKPGKLTVRRDTLTMKRTRDSIKEGYIVGNATTLACPGLRCPICGLMDSDYFHIAGHMLSYERHKGRGMPEGAGGPPVYFLTFREAAMIGGAAIERGLTRFRNRRVIAYETP